MSAYVVTDNTIKAVALYATKPHTGMHDDIEMKEANRVANLLITENYASVNARYNEDDAAPTLRITIKDEMKLNTVTLADVAMAAHCISYQSCEHDAWKESEANQVIQRVYDSVSFAMAQEQGAKWGGIE